MELLVSSCPAKKWRPVHRATLTSPYVEPSPSSGYMNPRTQHSNVLRGAAAQWGEQSHSDMSWWTEPPHIPTLTRDETTAGEEGCVGSVEKHKTRQPWSAVRWTLPPFCLDFASCHLPSCSGWPSISMHHPLNMQSRLPPLRRAIKSERSREGRV